jgi:hypothetical protein
MSGEISSCRNAKYDAAGAKCQAWSAFFGETIFFLFFNIIMIE